jgi:UDP-glucuronate 4-epimerase
LTEVDRDASEEQCRMNVEERFLITGALGCIGSWAVWQLAKAGTPVVAADIGDDRQRWRLLDPSLEDRVPLVRCDITDAEGFLRLVEEHRITHIVHLAALQVPFVRAQPMLGARVNVEGVAVVLEAARRASSQIRGLSLASSIAVYGEADRYGDSPLPHDAPGAPTTLYGAYKQADEWMARIYAADYGVPSVTLRPAVVYGPGRDQGLTSGPTLAMLAAAVGRPYHIAWGGYAAYQHAADVAAAFVAAARAADGPSDAYNLPGETAAMEDVVVAIREVVGGEPRITFEPSPLPFPSAFDGSPLERRLGHLHTTPLREGIRQTIEAFREAAAAGRLDPDRLLRAVDSGRTGSVRFRGS